MNRRRRRPQPAVIDDLCNQLLALRLRLEQLDHRAVDEVPNERNGWYASFEERFRGSQEAIFGRLQVYVDDVLAAKERSSRLTAFDIGAGRVEWLRLVAGLGMQASGVDQNDVFVEMARAGGLDVRHGDAVDTLRGVHSESVAVVSAFHVVEHLTLEYLKKLLGECFRVLAPGGLLLLETPNCASLSVAASTFWIDPTHQRPLHPEVLVYLVEEAGFSGIERRFLHEIAPVGATAADFADQPESIQILARAVFGFGDFALIARR